MSKHPFWYHAPRLCLAAALAAILGFVAFEVVAGKQPEVTPASQTSALTSVPLIDEGGGATTLAAFQGRWLVLFFGYATCPDVCPTSLAYLSQELKQLGAAADQTRGVFISVDPKRDKPDALGRYVHYFDRQLIALTGSDDNLRRLSRQLGVFFEIQPAPKGSPQAAYTLAHTASFFILSPEGQLTQTLSPPFERGAVVTALRTAMQAQAH